MKKDQEGDFEESVLVHGTQFDLSLSVVDDEP